MNRDEVVRLAWELAGQIALQRGISFDGFTPSAEGALEIHVWSRGSAELIERLERALLMTGGGRVSSGDLFPELEI